MGPVSSQGWTSHSAWVRMHPDQSLALLLLGIEVLPCSEPSQSPAPGQQVVGQVSETSGQYFQGTVISHRHLPPSGSALSLSSWCPLGACPSHFSKGTLCSLCSLEQMLELRNVPVWLLTESLSMNLCAEFMHNCARSAPNRVLAQDQAMSVFFLQ